MSAIVFQINFKRNKYNMGPIKYSHMRWYKKELVDIFVHFLNILLKPALDNSPLNLESSCDQSSILCPGIGDKNHISGNLKLLQAVFGAMSSEIVQNSLNHNRPFHISVVMHQKISPGLCLCPCIGQSS